MYGVRIKRDREVKNRQVEWVKKRLNEKNIIEIKSFGNDIDF